MNSKSILRDRLDSEPLIYDENDPATHSEVRKMFDEQVAWAAEAGPHHIRSIAEALGRKPAAGKYSPDMSKHYALGTGGRTKNDNLEFAQQEKL